MKFIITTAFIAGAIFMSSCDGGSTTTPVADTATTDSTAISNTADEKTATDPNSIDTKSPSLLNGNIQRKLIKTVGYDFKVAAVEKTAYEIDAIVKQMNGYATNATLKNEIVNEQTFPYSKDSLLQVSTYNTINNMTIYVPAPLLDSMMQLIQQKIGFLNSRDISVEDVSLKMMENEMDINTQNKYTGKMQSQIDKGHNKLTQIDTVQKNILSTDLQGNSTVIDNISMNDRVKYSQVNISLSQNTMITKTVIPNTNIMLLYKPSFVTRAQEAIENGFENCLDIIVDALNIWFVFVLMFLVWVAIKKRKLLFGWVR
ncbi:MAG TPA: DUF4349 domain-containing protein [Ferruginibacter sp.]|nr:DUF4349 domain-containing protein [Ferruginibacter sp.]